MENESKDNGISTTELLMIIGGGLLFMNWLVGLAFIVVPIAMFEWQERSKDSSPVSRHEGKLYITSDDMVAAT